MARERREETEKGRGQERQGTKRRGEKGGSGLID